MPADQWRRESGADHVGRRPQVVRGRVAARRLPPPFPARRGRAAPGGRARPRCRVTRWLRGPSANRGGAGAGAVTAAGRRWPGGLSPAAAASAAWWFQPRSRPPASSTGWARWALSTRRPWPRTVCWPGFASGCWGAAPWGRRWAPGQVSARPGRPRRGSFSGAPRAGGGISRARGLGQAGRGTRAAGTGPQGHRTVWRSARGAAAGSRAGRSGAEAEGLAGATILPSGPPASREPLSSSPRNVPGQSTPVGSVVREAPMIGTRGTAGGRARAGPAGLNSVSPGQPGAQRGAGAAPQFPARPVGARRPPAPGSRLIADVRPAPSPPPPEERGRSRPPLPGTGSSRAVPGRTAAPAGNREKSCAGGRGKSPARAAGELRSGAKLMPTLPVPAARPLLGPGRAREGAEARVALPVEGGTLPVAGRGWRQHLAGNPEIQERCGSTAEAITRVFLVPRCSNFS